MRACLTWSEDPGPCPVCGVPHTACVSPDYRGGPIVGPLRRPGGLPVARRVVPPVPLEATRESIATKDYRGRDAKGRVKRG